MRNAPAEIADHVDVGESLHWFEVNIDDLGEPGSHNEPEGCDPLGFGRNGGTELADCDCPDFYRIRIYEGMDDSSAHHVRGLRLHRRWKFPDPSADRPRQQR